MLQETVPLLGVYDLHKLDVVEHLEKQTTNKKGHGVGKGSETAVDLGGVRRKKKGKYDQNMLYEIDRNIKIEKNPTIYIRQKLFTDPPKKGMSFLTSDISNHRLALHILNFK